MSKNNMRMAKRQTSNWENYDVNMKDKFTLDNKDSLQNSKKKVQL